MNSKRVVPNKSQRVAPRRKFSQNFLTDATVAKRIVGALSIEDGDHVVEIGPGEGALTRLLLNEPLAKIHAFDIDQRVVEHNRQLIDTSGGRLTIELKDVLEVELDQLFDGQTREKRKIIGNIPYGITSDILFFLFEHGHLIHSAVIMMQKEVAQRLAAKPRTKDYGILTLAAWNHAKVTAKFNVSPGSFFPRPSVTSTVVHFQFYDQPRADVPTNDFRAFVRAAFSQRRKVLSNALKAWWSNTAQSPLPDSTLQCGVRLQTARAEELAPEQFVEVFKELRTLRGVINA